MTESITPTVPLDDAPEPELITLTCGECGHQATGAAKGRNSAAWKLGTHRYVKHGESKRKGTKAKTDAAAERLGARPVLGVVHDIADAVTTRTGNPTGDDLAAAGGRALMWISLGGASLMVGTDPRIPDTPEGDAVRDRIIDELLLPEKVGTNIMRPVGRMVAPTRINKRYGRGAVDNVDVLGSAVDLMEVVRTWSRYMRDRRAGTSALEAPAGAGGVAGPGGLYYPPAGYVPAAADLEGITTPPPTTGFVVSAEDIQRMQRGH